jgi:hypothetical protein
MTSARAQFGGRQRNRGDGSSGTSRRGDEQSARTGNPPPPEDAIIAVERELPSLRIDLNLSPAQAALFDSFERDVRDAAEAGRLRPRHVGVVRADDGASVPAATIFNIIADDDAQRADATRLARETLKTLFAALTPEQQRQFDRRIVQSLREPLGRS